MIGIYKITNPNGRVYIGQSNNIQRRFYLYQKKICKKQKLLYRSLLKHGVENHKFEVIEECNLELLNERERYWQEYHNVLENGLNLCLVSTKDKKYVHSKESLIKISIAHSGKKLSKEHLLAIRKSKVGCKLSKEHLEKLLSGKRPLSNKCKPIINLNNGVFYETVREAAFSININRNTLKLYLNGKRKNKTKMIYA